MKISRFPAIALVASMALGAPSFAQSGDPIAKSDVPPGKRIAMEVFTYAFEIMGDLIEPNMKLRMLFVAKQKAAAMTCDGFEVDDARMTTVMNTALAKLAALTEEGQNNLPLDVAMHAYGVMLGGELAQAAYDRAAYCAFAQELREEFKDDTEGLVSIWK